MDLRQFANKMELRATKLAPNVEKLKQKVATAVLTAVAEDTPVDSGRAISNWDVGINAAKEVERDPYAPGQKGSTQPENIHATIAAGTQVINTSTPGSVIHISNPLPYIGALNDGSSTQAPAAFIEKAVLKGVAEIRKAKLIED